MFERIESGADQVVLTLRGILDGEGLIAMRDSLEAIAASSSRDLVLDFSNVTFMDGSGISAIAYVFKRLACKGHRLELVGVTGQPAKLLREMGLDTLFALPSKATRRPHFFRPGWVIAR